MLIAPLARRGITARPVVWEDPAVDWAAFDLVLLRSTWDYSWRRDEFLRWAASVPAEPDGRSRLVNPVEVIAGNTDKRYLARLAEAGVPVVATQWLAPGRSSWRPVPEAGEVVVKPAVSAGSRDTGRYDLTDAEHRVLAAAHVARLQEAGRLVMVQPYLSAVDSAGETAQLYFGGAYSHAVRKGAMLQGPHRDSDELYKEERIGSRQPTPQERTAADAVLEAARRVLAVPEDLLYARVDLIAGPDGTPLLVELELTEPSVFLGCDPDAADRFADAIVSRLST